jgi:hypothetical protein
MLKTSWPLAAKTSSIWGEGGGKGRNFASRKRCLCNSAASLLGLASVSPDLDGPPAACSYGRDCFWLLIGGVVLLLVD